MKNCEIKIILYILLSLTVFTVSYAKPVPHGVDGTVYELDGITPIGNNIGFSVYDTATGEFIEGKIRNNGKYSVSLDGNNGDVIVIRTWNNYHSYNRNVTLKGVMHDVNLLLNTTMPQFPPSITSIPITEAKEDQLYIYDVEAQDENNDILKYSLLNHPTDMIIDSETGIIEWVPENAGVGNHSILIVVSDGNFSINQSFILKVINVNDAPEIISGPITSATEDQLYSYDVKVVDVDDEIVYYYLDEKTNGMNISQNGLIEWIPTNDDVGQNNITIRVSDGELEATQPFSINVINTNDGFIINSTPITVAIEDELYTYNVDAYDMDGDILSYELIESPNSVTIDSLTGIILWTPTNGQLGDNSVIVEVTDGILYQNHSFIINVLNVNDPPNITSEPVTTAQVFRLYVYKVNATDPENDELTYSLLEKPSNMHINEKTGLIVWVPLIRHRGDNEVIVEVSDGDLSINQTFNITVSFDLLPETPSGSRGGGGGADSLRIVNELTEEQIAETEKIAELEGVEDIVEEEITKIMEKISNVVTRVTLKGKLNEDVNVEVNELPERPKNVKGLTKSVYKYLELRMDKDLEGVEDILIQFKVEKSWLDGLGGVDVNDLTLSRFVDNNWEELPTNFIDYGKDYLYYESRAKGFSYFAISLKYLKEPNSAIITGPKEPHIISGVIYKNNNEQVSEGTVLRITNADTGGVVIARTGFKQNPGGYYTIINGDNGDKINIEVRRGMIFEKTAFILNGDMKNVDLIVSNNGLTAVTGYTVGVLDNLLGKQSIMSLLSIILLISSLLFFRKYIKHAQPLNKSDKNLNQIKRAISKTQSLRAKGNKKRGE